MENEQRHTPGPWHVAEVDGVAYILNRGESAPQGITAVQLRDCGLGYHESLANALLISAAPELLFALKRVLGSYHITQQDGPMWGLVRAAIAKAEGK